jgi:heptosyltransferase-2
MTDSPAVILLWHQGALGDLLLAGPALAAVRRQFPETRLVAVGHPERWGLLREMLSLEAVWDGSDGLWAWLFAERGGLPPALTRRLAEVDLALVFSPRPPGTLVARLQEGGVRHTAWLPSFPGNGGEHLSRLQARRLAELGLAFRPQPLRLVLDWQRYWPEEVPPGSQVLAVAPGSGNPAKNWPIEHFYEVTRTLAWETDLPIVWLSGPAEAAWLPYLSGLARAQGHFLLHQRPLKTLAALLSQARLYLGNDSGLTHLAAAAGARRVLALFGPTDPTVWAPLGETVTVLTAPPDRRWQGPSPQQVLSLARQLIQVQ